MQLSDKELLTPRETNVLIVWANLYPNEKDQKRKNKPDEPGHNEENSRISEMWVLRMINPQHNHAPDPINKRRDKRHQELWLKSQ